MSNLPEFLITVSTLRDEYSAGAKKEGLPLPHVTRSLKMDASLAHRWVVRSRTEHASIYSYHLETTEGEIFNEESN